MRTILIFGGIALALLVGFLSLSRHDGSIPKETATTTPPQSEEGEAQSVTVRPISHATMALQWGGLTLLTDPVGEQSWYEGITPDIVLLTDIHGDHLSTSTLTGIGGAFTIIAPQAVADLLPEDLKARTTVLENDDRLTLRGFSITAFPMYNLPETEDSRHVKGRGNGYLIERSGYRVYIAGDTAGIPEMRALTDIDIAFIPMNLPFTMSVEEAADAVIAFKPRRVYPYHYRGEDGLSDVNRFKELVEDADIETEVMLLDWYPSQPVQE